MKKVKIRTTLPENHESFMDRYFLDLRDSEVKTPTIKKLNNVFVSHQGLVLNNGLLERGCAFNLIGKEDNTFYWEYWKLALEQMLVSKFGESLKSIHLQKDTQYLLIHSKWFNYSFWVNSFLVRLHQAEEEIGLENVVLIYPEGWAKISYVVESLKCFDVKVQLVPTDHHMFVKHLIMPETREWTASFSPNQLKKLRAKIIPYVQKYTTLKNTPENIYLTRNKATKRKVKNESQLQKILDNYQFKTLDFEDYCFWDQVVLMQNAKCFISIHGAGFSNIIFMDPGNSVLELVNRSYADLEYKFPFWKLANARNLRYFVQFGEVDEGVTSRLIRVVDYNDTDEYLVNENITIDLKLFENNLKMMLGIHS